jgi:hypothetical protein
MKYHIRVPAEQFAYLEAEFEGTADEAVAEYRHLTSLVAGAKGLESKDFNAILDEYLTTGKISGDPALVAEQMSVEQVAIIQSIKRSRARTNK